MQHCCIFSRRYLAFGLAAFTVLIGLGVPDASAQVLYGSINGNVTDQTSAAVPDATVTVKKTATGASREATTDSGGYYAFQNLSEGSYDVSVSGKGFKTLTEKGVRVLINNVTRVALKLEVGDLTQSVTVEASTAMLQTSKTDVNTTVEARAIENLPLSNYRNYQSLINLVPGATPGRFQNAVIDTPMRDFTFNVNGQERGANNTRVDGAANVLVTMPHHMVYVPPVESIAEVNVSTNAFDAEQGMTGGAAVTVSTKSGTNEFHGSVFEMHQDNALRSFLWDENRAGITRKPKSIRNIGGYSVGGPIKKNKLFFFTDWEGTFERIAYSGLFSVPRDDFRSGDFSRTLGAQILDANGASIQVPTTESGRTTLREGMIFDPYSGSIDGTGRSVFSNNGRLNVLPSSRLNAPMMKLLALVPQSNLPGDFSNFYNSSTQRLNRNNIDAKVNWNRSVKHQLWVKYSAMNALVHEDPALGEAMGPALGGGGVGNGHTLVQIAAIGQTYTISPTFLVDGTLGWTRFGQNVRPPDLGKNFGSDVLGLPGTNGVDPRESGKPAFNFSDYTSLGNTEGWNPAFRNDQSFTFNTNASWIKSVHEIRFGFDFVHHLMNHWQPELGDGPRGAFYFNPGVTALNPDALGAASGFQGGTPSFENSWNSMAAFLLGVPTDTAKSSQNIKMASLENQFALYVRDRWRVTPKLTISLGLRWELYPNRTRPAGMGIESYDSSTNEVLIGGRGGLPRDLGVGFSKKLFAPRFGFAYQLGKSTVIRSGYGITSHSHPWGAQALRGWYPLTIAANYSGVNGYQPVTTSPSYVAAGIPNAPLGPTVGIVATPSPDISKGRVSIPDSVEMGYPLANKELRRGYIQSWNFIVEHSFPGQLVASIGYVGSASVNGFAFLDVNASQIPGSGDDGRPLFAQFGRTATTREWDGRTHSNYHSLQASFNRRISSGLLIQGSYTYSHSIDMANYDDWTGFDWNAASVFNRNRGTSSFDTPHNFQMAFVYDLPFGKDQKWATTGIPKVMLGGWQLNGVFGAFSGRPFTVTASGASLNMPGNLQTADQVKTTVETIGKTGDAGTWFDTSAFARPTGARFGTVGRNTMRGPSIVSADASLFRAFKLKERFNLQLRAEGFNISNTPHFGNPNSDANSSNFGRILSTDSGLAQGRSREFRFGLRLGF